MAKISEEVEVLVTYIHDHFCSRKGEGVTIGLPATDGVITLGNPYCVESGAYLTMRRHTLPKGVYKQDG